MNREVLKRCELILRLYYSRESWPQEMIDRVQAWLVNGEHCREKDLAARRIFYEMLEECDPGLPDRMKETIDR